jgi:hypothetical protein
MTSLARVSTYFPKDREVTTRNKVCQLGAAAALCGAIAWLYRSRTSPWIAGGVGVMTGIFVMIRYIDAADSEGRSALHNSVIKGHSTLAKTLLLFGANPNTADHRYLTPVYTAADRVYAVADPENIHLLKTLVAARGNIRQTLYRAIEDVDGRVVTALLAHTRTDTKIVYEGSKTDYPLVHAQRVLQLVNKEEYKQGPEDLRTLDEFKKDAQVIVNLLENPTWGDYSHRFR